MEWNKFGKAHNITFSDVINCFDLNFGWNLNAKIYRYTNRGAMIKLTNGSESVDVSSSSIKDLSAFRKANLNHKDYMTLVYPTGSQVEVFKNAQSKPQEKIKTSMPSQNHWIITGSEENLIVGIKHGLWGVKQELKVLWDKLRKGDLVAFYCTKPVSGIIGYGEVIDSHVDTKPFWPNEKTESESRYPLRIKFKKINVADDWHEKKAGLHGTGIEYFNGLNYIEPDKRKTLLKKLKII